MNMSDRYEKQENERTGNSEVHAEDTSIGLSHKCSISFDLNEEAISDQDVNNEENDEACDHELVFREFVEFKVLKLTVDCLPLISFELSIIKKYKFSSWGYFAHKYKTSGGYLQNFLLTNRKI